MSKNNFMQTNAFSCPVYKIRIDPSSYDKEEIINDIKYNKSFKNTRNNSKAGFDDCDIHHSYADTNNEDFRIINYEKLTDVYLKIFTRFVEEELYTKKAFKLNVNIVNYSAITEGQWMTNHNHLGRDESASFATIHYLNFKDGHVPTTFNNPMNFTPFLKTLAPELYDILDTQLPDNSYLVRSGQPKIEEDDMFIFPAALNHQVMPQRKTKEPRITIASNITLSSPLTLPSILLPYRV